MVNIVEGKQDIGQLRISTDDGSVNFIVAPEEEDRRLHSIEQAGKQWYKILVCHVLSKVSKIKLGVLLHN